MNKENLTNNDSNDIILNAGEVSKDTPRTNEEGSVQLRSPAPNLTAEDIKTFEVKLVTRKEISDFIEKWHYSHNMNGLMHTYCFGLYRKGELIGAAVFGQPATPGVAEAYSNNRERKIIELRRLVLIDDTPRNSESYFIGRMIRYLKKSTDEELILSYADTTHGHEGIVYKATNFTCIGKSPAVKKILSNGKLYHDKSLRCKYNGKLKPFSVRLGEALKNGEAKWVETKPKNIYLLDLRK